MLNPGLPAPYTLHMQSLLKEAVRKEKDLFKAESSYQIPFVRWPLLPQVIIFLSHNVCRIVGSGFSDPLVNQRLFFYTERIFSLFSTPRFCS